MTSNAARATTLVRALRAGIERDRRVLEDLFTEDVRAWTPALSTVSLTELINELDRRDDAFSAIEPHVVPLDVGGDYACVEWSVAMTHSGRLGLAGERTSTRPASASCSTASRWRSSEANGSVHSASTGTSLRCSRSSESLEQTAKGPSQPSEHGTDPVDDHWSAPVPSG